MVEHRIKGESDKSPPSIAWSLNAKDYGDGGIRLWGEGNDGSRKVVMAILEDGTFKRFPGARIPGLKLDYCGRIMEATESEEPFSDTPPTEYGYYRARIGPKAAVEVVELAPGLGEAVYARRTGLGTLYNPNVILWGRRVA